MMIEYKGLKPKLGKNVYVAKTATVIGDVILEDDVSVWPSAVIRADVAQIHIGRGSNVQDGVVIHVSKGLDCKIGAGVTLGHLSHVHSACIHDDVLIGSGSIILDEACVHSNIMVAAGSLVAPKKQLILSGLYLGSPALFKRDLSEAEKKHIVDNALEYIELKTEYLGD